MSLADWADMPGSITVQLLDDRTRDAWGNKIESIRHTCSGWVISEKNEPGNTIDSGTETQPVRWYRTVVTEWFVPAPEQGQLVKLNGVEHKITEVEVLRDALGKAYQLECANMEEVQS